MIRNCCLCHCLDIDSSSEESARTHHLDALSGGLSDGTTAEEEEEEELVPVESDMRTLDVRRIHANLRAADNRQNVYMNWLNVDRLIDDATLSDALKINLKLYYRQDEEVVRAQYHARIMSELRNTAEYLKENRLQAKYRFLFTASNVSDDGSSMSEEKLEALRRDVHSNK